MPEQNKLIGILFGPIFKLKKYYNIDNIKHNFFLNILFDESFKIIFESNF